MNLKSLKIGRAFNLVMKTLPITMVRLGALMVFWFVAIIYFAIVGGIAWLIGQAVPLIGIIVFLIGIGGMGFIYKLAKQYVLYLIKAAHIAVIAELVSKGSLPEGINQLAYGKEQVQKRFGESSAMFVVDKLVEAIVRTFTRTVYRIASFLPGDFFKNIAAVVNRVITFALNYVDEAILARTFWLDSGSVWANARDGVVLYGMVWKPMLMNAIALMILSYIPFAVVMLLVAAPIGALMWFTVSPAAGGWAIIVLLVLAYLVKVALGDAFAMTAIIAAYHDEIMGLEPDPKVSAKLESVSDKFRELQKKATESLRGTPKETDPVTEPPAEES